MMSYITRPLDLLTSGESLLLHPLEESSGGDFFHSGGKHWTSQNDPEWQTLRNWVMGQTK